MYEMSIKKKRESHITAILPLINGYLYYAKVEIISTRYLLEKFNSENKK